MKKLHQKQREFGNYSVVNNIGFLMRTIIAYRPFLFVLIVMDMTFTVITPVISIYLPSYAVTLVTEQAGIREILLKLGGLGLILAIMKGLERMAAEGKYFLYNSMRNYLQKKIFFKSLHCDYVHVESKQGMNLYQRALDNLLMGDGSGTSRMLISFMGFLTGVLSFVIYSGILTGLHPIVVVLLTGISVVNLVLFRYAQSYEYKQKDEMAVINQKLNYVEHTAKDTGYAKDIRLYNMSGWFLETRNTLMGAFAKIANRVRNRFFAVSSINAFTRVLQDGISYGYLIYCVINGRIDIDAFVLYFGAITGFSDYVRRISDNFNTLQSANMQMNDIRKYLDLTESSSAKPGKSQELPKVNSYDIVFDHVWFSYGEEGEPVLQDFCLHIKEGEKLALVGVNGAGKTTLVKLLCSFYKPEKGTIKIGGVDISKCPKEELYRLISAVFQDLYIDPFTVAENVSMQLEAETDMVRVEECLKRTGLLDTIRSYPEHIHSYMNRSIHEGIVLSGGQQQKLLMARALYKEAPIMFLDEPTAALDPIAESETYENFHTLTEDKTVIYISHRLASTRFCDKIVFLKEGRNAEMGSHNELMKLGGEYARMYEVQSHYYQKGGKACENKAIL